MGKMLEILKILDGLAVSPVSEGADIQNEIISKELPFKVYKFRSGREYNGWIVPKKWKVKKATIKYRGNQVYNGLDSPLGVIGSSESFKDRISLEELKKHLFYKKDRPNDIVYHCDLYYKPFLRNWGFCVPYNLYKSLKKGVYEVDLETTHTVGSMKVLEYTHKGKAKDTIIINAHNCHAAQLNDGPSGFIVGIEIMKRLKKVKTKYTYKLVIAPEHLGTVFYLSQKKRKSIDQLKYCIFLEMLGNNWPHFSLQQSFTGNTELDHAAHNWLKFNDSNYKFGLFRKIVGNDETVWEAPGIEVPTITLSRCQSPQLYYPQYHTDKDNLKIIKEKMLEKSCDALLGIINTLEKNTIIKRKFTGLIALSNPKYDLYQRYLDPSIDRKVSEDEIKWNYLMNCLPRYFDGKTSILKIAQVHDLPFESVYDYILRFQEKGLVKIVD